MVLCSLGIFLSLGAILLLARAAACRSPEVTTPRSPVVSSWSGFPVEMATSSTSPVDTLLFSSKFSGS